ncbi:MULTISPECIES: flagellar motor protein MotB [unclassified Fusibacter]|uniref:OmpA/MotB family protein n=1 Tax=unclassified Fusibacter TaxID=2624464 RepID=UPI0010123C22|nr:MULTISPECIES: flagellar motor protein MotB [unclassified Fusibacter]MCK8058766.1 flagellar motor protein MotB [Fusibacter sp. A2]NPE21840.1 flagellar motor protein MotB [Fusibacter sp. A1]RXV61412.1 flagellar motor protein MotB [Fusibacter sp. A1]
MSKKQKKCEEGGGAPEWMATYGDLVTLLMCFFVLLFAFSEIDAQKFDAVMQSFQGSAGVLQSGESMSPSELLFDGMPENKKTEDGESNKKNQEVEALKEEIEKFKQESGVDFEIGLVVEERGLKITFPDNALFDSAKADLKPDALLTLDFMSQVLNEDMFKGRQIRIEGHTDNVPINTLRFPSNWELSTIRATTVLRYFTEIKAMEDSRFMALGYGEYRPVSTNDSSEGRSQNRRVDIVVLTEEEQEKEPSN